MFFKFPISISSWAENEHIIVRNAKAALAKLIGIAKINSLNSTLKDNSVKKVNLDKYL